MEYILFTFRFALGCLWNERIAGVRKAYWITCNVEPDIQYLSLDRSKIPSSFVVRPRDLNRLLGNFQSNLQEITIIATEPTSSPSDAASEIGGKAVELRSYIDPTKGESGYHHFLYVELGLCRYFILEFIDCREWIIATHSAMDRSNWRVCAIYSHRGPCWCYIWCEGIEGIVNDWVFNFIGLWHVLLCIIIITTILIMVGAWSSFSGSINPQAALYYTIKQFILFSVAVSDIVSDNSWVSWFSFF